jgi:hypothetical protein
MEYDEIQKRIAENNALAAKMRLDYAAEEKAKKNRVALLDAICLGTGIILASYILNSVYPIDKAKAEHKNPKTIESKLIQSYSYK